MRKVLTGVVTSDKGAKTLKVEISRRFSHPMYGKIVRGRTVATLMMNKSRQNKAMLLKLLNVVRDQRPNVGNL